MPLIDKTIRVVCDVNIWVSYLLTPVFCLRCRMLFYPPIQILVSDTLYFELSETLDKLVSKKRLTSNGNKQLLNRLYDKAELVKVTSVIRACRDADDNYLLALSNDGNADYLITRDKDLLVLKTFENTKIVSLEEFEKLFVMNF